MERLLERATDRQIDIHKGMGDKRQIETLIRKSRFLFSSLVSLIKVFKNRLRKKNSRTIFLGFRVK